MVETQNMSDDDLIIINNQRPTRVDAIRNRALLLETAEGLFSQCGVESVTMSEIARAAGVGKGTLYRHFENKIELAFAILDHQSRELQNATLERLNENYTSFDNLKWLIDQVIQFTVVNRELLRVDSNNARFLLHPAHYWVRQTIHILLKEITTAADPWYMADILYVMLDVAVIEMQLEQGHDEDDLATNLYELLDRIIE